MITITSAKEHAARKASAEKMIDDNIKRTRLSVMQFDALLGDTRLSDYLHGLRDSPEAHNLYELLAGVRFLRFLQSYTFDARSAVKFITFFEHLPLLGSGGRKCHKVSPVQLFQFVNIYGFFRADGKRLTREVLLFVPRKYGKTTICAAMALYDSLFGDYDAEAYISANSFKQAKKGFDGIKNLVEYIDPSANYFSTNLQTVKVHVGGREAIICCLSNSPSRLDGLKASISISDELSQATSFALKNVISTSMGVRENPLTVDITTASSVVEGPFVSELENYKSILLSELEETNPGDDPVFASIFSPDAGDDESSPEVWRKVNPHIGYTVQLDFYAGEYAKAQRSFDNLLAFRTKLLNVFVAGTLSTWIPSEVIWRSMRPIDLDSFSEPPVTMCSFDLSVKDDFSAVTYMCLTTDKFMSKTIYYFPRGALERHTNKELYTKWAEEGYLVLLPGDVIDYARIANDIIATNEKLFLCGIGYDPYRDTELINMLKAYGAGSVLKSIGQTRANFTAPVGQMEILTAQDRIIFDNNPITAWCFNNAVIDEDNNGNRKPMKRTEGGSGKIDGCITNLMCIKMFDEAKR